MTETPSNPGRGIICEEPSKGIARLNWRQNRTPLESLFRDSDDSDVFVKVPKGARGVRQGRRARCQVPLVFLDEAFNKEQSTEEVIGAASPEFDQILLRKPSRERSVTKRISTSVSNGMGGLLDVTAVDLLQSSKVTKSQGNRKRSCSAGPRYQRLGQEKAHLAMGPLKALNICVEQLHRLSPLTASLELHRAAVEDAGCTGAIKEALEHLKHQKFIKGVGRRPAKSCRPHGPHLGTSKRVISARDASFADGSDASVDSYKGSPPLDQTPAPVTGKSNLDDLLLLAEAAETMESQPLRVVKKTPPHGEQSEPALAPYSKPPLPPQGIKLKGVSQKEAPSVRTKGPYPGRPHTSKGHPLGAKPGPGAKTLNSLVGSPASLFCVERPLRTPSTSCVSTKSDLPVTELKTPSAAARCVTPRPQAEHCTGALLGGQHVFGQHSLRSQVGITPGSADKGADPQPVGSQGAGAPLEVVGPLPQAIAHEATGARGDWPKSSGDQHFPVPTSNPGPVLVLGPQHDSESLPGGVEVVPRPFPMPHMPPTTSPTQASTLANLQQLASLLRLGPAQNGGQAYSALPTDITTKLWPEPTKEEKGCGSGCDLQRPVAACVLPSAEGTMNTGSGQPVLVRDPASSTSPPVHRGNGLEALAMIPKGDSSAPVETPATSKGPSAKRPRAAGQESMPGKRRQVKRQEQSFQLLNHEGPPPRGGHEADLSPTKTENLVLQLQRVFAERDLGQEVRVVPPRETSTQGPLLATPSYMEPPDLGLLSRVMHTGQVLSGDSGRPRVGLVPEAPQGTSSHLDNLAALLQSSRHSLLQPSPAGIMPVLCHAPMTPVSTQLQPPTVMVPISSLSGAKDDMTAQVVTLVPPGSTGGFGVPPSWGLPSLSPSSSSLQSEPSSAAGKIAGTAGEAQRREVGGQAVASEGATGAAKGPWDVPVTSVPSLSWDAFLKRPLPNGSIFQDRGMWGPLTQAAPMQHTMWDNPNGQIGPGLKVSPGGGLLSLPAFPAVDLHGMALAKGPSLVQSMAVPMIPSSQPAVYLGPPMQVWNAVGAGGAWTL